VAQRIGTKRKGRLEEQNLICRCKKPRFWTEEEEYSQQKPERQELQAKRLLIPRLPSLLLLLLL